MTPQSLEIDHTFGPTGRANLLDVKFDHVANHGCADITGVAVVIDVLRAFSFCAFALDAGVARLIVMDDLDETLEVARRIPGGIAGKDGAPAEGFELFNSPGQLLERDDLAGRTVVHRTGAGTVGAVAARRADHVFCASFVVAEATAARVRALDPGHVTFVISGDDGRADDDLACAEYLAHRIERRPVDPTPFLERVSVVGQGLRDGLARGYRGVHADDVDLCMDVDRFHFAMRAVDGDDGLLEVVRA